MNTSASHKPALISQPATAATLHELLVRVESEYQEMPGMCVTLAQAQRLWGLDTTTCSFVLSTLVERRILKRTSRGTYVTFDDR
jgi:predicted transcriptional regulator of viral defense system